MFKIPSTFKIYAIGIIVGLLVLGGYGLVKYGRTLERADHAVAVVDYLDQIATLAQAIQAKEDKLADAGRKAADHEKEKIDAIKTADHQNAKVKRLEKALRLAATTDGPIDDNHYRVIITNSTQRVWNEGRNCDGLPESESPGILPKRLHEVTGDDINKVIKHAQKEYCGVALKYNQLWRAADRLISETGKKIPDP